MKKLGVMNPEPHLGALLKAGGFGPEDKKVAYTEFSVALVSELGKRKRAASQLFILQLKRIAATMTARDLSLFDLFVMLDVNQTGKLSKLELKTGMQ